MHAVIAFLLLVLLSLACLVAGVLLIAGTGWALIAAALSFFGLAAIVRRGMRV